MIDQKTAIWLSALGFLWGAAGTTNGQTFQVDSAVNFTPTGIFAEEGEMFRIEANGQVDLAVPDTYVTDPDGTIITAPAAGSGAFNFFTDSTFPNGFHPTVGQRKLVAMENWLPFAPHGALLAGYFLSTAQLAEMGYPDQFRVIGRNAEAPPRPEGARDLILVNNLATPFGTSGQYNLRVFLVDGRQVTSVMNANDVLPLPANVGIAGAISATGTIDLAANGGGYVVQPDGRIVTAPARGSAAFNFFRDMAGPVGAPPNAGRGKLVLPRHPRQMTPYGALVAGWSNTANATNYSDFSVPFQYVGSSGIVTAPEGGGFLTLAVNDFFSLGGSDNDGFYTVTVEPIPQDLPQISAAIMLTGFGGGPTITPGGFVEIYGLNLAEEPRVWTEEDFVDGVAPTTLEGVKVLINGIPAFLYFLSPTQLNVIAPDGLPEGTAEIVVMKGDEMSAAFEVSVAPRAPALLAPPSFRVGEQQLAAGFLQDGSYVGPKDFLEGASFRPAAGGDRIVFYGIGFGQGDPIVPVGTVVSEATTLPNVEVKFGDVPAAVEYAGFTPGIVGLYQLNVVVPPGVSGLVRLMVSIDGVPVEQELWVQVE